MAESPSLLSLKGAVTGAARQVEGKRSPLQHNPPTKKVSPVQQSLSVKEDNPLSIQGEATSKQAVRQGVATKEKSRVSNNLQQPTAVSQSKKKESVLSNIRRDSADSGNNDYEADEFEKEDLVQMAEPTKPKTTR